MMGASSGRATTCQVGSEIPMPASGFAGRGVGVGMCAVASISYPSSCSPSARASAGAAGTPGDGERASFSQWRG